MSSMCQESDALVSLIIPVYNAQDYLPLCIDSVLGQSYRNLEVILVDDGSTDKSSSICDAYARKDSRVRVLHQGNGGIAKAQNAGLNAVRGDYIAFADNDDILDRRNIELLMQALVKTGADMSKGRWRQFGLSQMQNVQREAGAGAEEPGTITVFTDPLRAYQTVFSKALRLLGEAAGRHSEARYLNEANWCRLYRADLWEGIRFPEGRYAQDTAVAGRLYARMNKVADIDTNLYNWLQRPESVTHSKQKTSFYHDHIQAALENMALCREKTITPARSYYTLMGNLRYERNLEASSEGTSQLLVADQEAAFIELGYLSLTQRGYCRILSGLRLLEKMVYDKRIKNLA